MTIKEGLNQRKWEFWLGVCQPCCRLRASSTRHYEAQDIVTLFCSLLPLLLPSGSLYMLVLGSLEPARGKNSSGNGGAPSSPKLSQVSSCLLGNRERQESRSREAAWPWPSNFLIGWLGSGEMPLILAALIHGKGMLLILYLERSTWGPLTDFMSEVTRRSPVMRFSGHFTRDLVGLPCPRLLGSEHHPGYHKIQSQWSFWSVELVSISSLSSKMQSKVENH